MADDKKPFPPKGDEKPADETAEEEAPAEGEADTEQPEEVPVDSATSEQYFQKAKAALAELGIPLPPGTTPENAWEHICVACHALMNQKKDPSEEDSLVVKPEDAAAQQPSREEPQLLSMSTVQKELAQTRLQLSAAHAKLAESEWRSLEKTIAELQTKGQITVERANDWRNKLGTKKLSLIGGADRGTDKVLAEIAFAQTIPEGTYWTAEERLQMSTGSHEQVIPAELSFDGEGEEGRQEMIDRIARRTRKKEKKAA